MRIHIICFVIIACFCSTFSFADSTTEVETKTPAVLTDFLQEVTSPIALSQDSIFYNQVMEEYQHLLLLIIFYPKDLIASMRTSKALIISLIILILGGAGVANAILLGKSARMDEVGISTPYNQKKYQTVLLVVSNYISHFNPNFLFFSGDINKRSQLSGFGQINFIYIPFLILGICYIFQKKRVEYLLPLTLLLIAPIPASITRESPHALRSIVAVPFVDLITSFGIYKLPRRAPGCVSKRG